MTVSPCFMESSHCTSLVMVRLFEQEYCYGMKYKLRKTMIFDLIVTEMLCGLGLLLMSELFKPLLGRTRSRGKWWAAIRLSHRPEPSGHAIRGEVDGLDIGEQHGRRFVLLCQTHRLQRWPLTHLYKQERKRPIVVWRRFSRTQALLGRVIPGVDECRCWGWKGGVLCGCPPTPHSIGDPPRAPHVCCCCQKNWWVYVPRVQMDVSIERPCVCTR